MGAEGIGEPRSNGGHEDIMKNYPAKASLEEMTGLYQYTILPLLVETDQFLKNLQGQKVNIQPSTSIQSKGYMADFLRK